MLLVFKKNKYFLPFLEHHQLRFYRKKDSFQHPLLHIDIHTENIKILLFSTNSRNYLILNSSLNTIFFNKIELQKM